MIVVIADDITGAAEIAAIGCGFGLKTKIQIESSKVHEDNTDMLVIDTCSRSKTAIESQNKIKELAQKLNRTSIDWCFKKVDSVFRGNISAELQALMKVLNKSHTVLAPANPSKGRTIVDGRYYINNVSIDDTDFKNDPEYPVKDNCVKSLMDCEKNIPVSVKKHTAYTRNEKGFVIAESKNENDMSLWAELLDDNTLAAGASDFFKAILKKYLKINQSTACKNSIQINGNKLFVCGSASDYSRSVVARAKRSGGPVFYMPDRLLEGRFNNSSIIQEWADNVISALSHWGKAVIAIELPVKRDIGFAEQLRLKMSELVLKVTQKIYVDELFLEGGATAEAVMDQMGWHDFNVIGQYCPGVVQMKVTDSISQYVTVKPGSYPWPDTVWN